MKSYDFEACAYDGDIYCNECLPDGIDTDHPEVMPVFADSEHDSYPVCGHCGAVHDYVCLTTYGQRQQVASGCFCGLRGYEIEMTIEQALGASHAGQCDSDVAALSRVPEIAAQLDSFTPDEIREALKEYGAWTDEELQDDEQNRQRALWSAACDIRENNRELA